MHKVVVALTLSVLLLTISSIQADTPAKPQHLTVPFNAQVTTNTAINFNGVIQMPPPIMLRVPTGSTMQLGPGTTIAVNGPLTLGGNFILQGTANIPKGTVLNEAPAATPSSRSHPSGPAHNVERQF